MIMPRNWLCKGYFGCHYFPSEATVVLYLKVIFFISAFEFSECFILTFVLLCSLCWWDFRDGKNGSLEDSVIQGEGPRASCSVCWQHVIMWTAGCTLYTSLLSYFSSLWKPSKASFCATAHKMMNEFPKGSQWTSENILRICSQCNDLARGRPHLISFPCKIQISQIP